MTALHLAAKGGHVGVIKVLFARHKEVVVDAKNNQVNCFSTLLVATLQYDVS